MLSNVAALLKLQSKLKLQMKMKLNLQSKLNLSLQLKLSPCYNYCQNHLLLCSILDTQVFLHKSSSAVTLKDLELSLSEYQRYLNKLDTIKWGDIERAASSIGQLTGIILHQVSYPK